MIIYSVEYILALTDWLSAVEIMPMETSTYNLNSIIVPIGMLSTVLLLIKFVVIIITIIILLPVHCHFFGWESKYSDWNICTITALIYIYIYIII